jgi:hypothetical protein
VIDTTDEEQHHDHLRPARRPRGRARRHDGPWTPIGLVMGHVVFGAVVALVSTAIV